MDEEYNVHFRNAARIYDERGADFANILAWHFAFGFVCCDPEMFCIGYFSHSSNPFSPVQGGTPNTAFVTMFSGDLTKLDSYMLRAKKLGVKFVAYQRQFKGSDELRFLKLDSLHSKLTKKKHGIST